MPNEQQETKSSIKNLLKVVWWTFKIYFTNWRWYSIGLLIGRLIRDSGPFVSAFLLGNLLDQALKMIATKNVDLYDLAPPLISLLVYEIIINAISWNLWFYCWRSIRSTSRPILERVYYRHLGNLGIETLENPIINNKLTRAEQWMNGLLEILDESLNFLSNVVMFIIASVIIIKNMPALFVVLLIFAIIKYIPRQYFLKKDFKWQTDNTEKKRHISDSIYYLKNTKELQEVKLNNATGYFDKSVINFFNWYSKGLLGIIRNNSIVNVFISTMDSVLKISGYGYIFLLAITEKITFGNVVFQIRALDSVSSNLSNLLQSITYLNEMAIKSSDLIFVLESKPMTKDGTKKIEKLKYPPTIEFNNVSFSYPQSDKLIFENLNLKIKSGEKVAIVGHNGAGKTTLVKLIARIYQVSGGSILVNNQNLNDLEIDSWYKNVGILFQEYNFYDHLSPKENIYLGRPDEPINEERIVQSAINADADSFINEFPKKYDQIMDEKFEGGIRPSTGQKQKIAIARFFYRNAPLAIFDEPTAAIDAVSEYNIFNRIYSFFNNKTVIIISHRFSTVRNADRIIVMDHGQIVEEGSHNQLLAMNGVYANAFKLQAEGYR